MSTVKPPKERAGLASLLKREFKLGDLVFLILVLLSLAGVAVTNYAPERSWLYWAIMVPLFAVISIVSSWSDLRGDPRGWMVVLRLQLLHWAALFLAVYLIYLLYRAGRLDDADTAMTILITLSLSTVLAGVHFDWHFGLVGLLLGLAVLLDTWLEEYLWIMGTTGLALLVLRFVMGRYVARRRAPETGHR
jgi:hypothetical protein